MTYQQEHTPLFDALRQHANREPVQFHIPGHKQGQGMDEEFRAFIGANACNIDLINIAPLDDLHQPGGVIRDTLKLAAEAFNADETFFSVQGTSGAIMAMIMSVCKPNDKIIVPRNVHKSVMSAIIWAGAKPVFVTPVADEVYGIAHGISTRSVRKAIQRHPDAKAVLVINPTYFGVCANLKEIVDVCHGVNIPVLVDEAHGVHLHFHDSLPVSAMDAGADMAATSVHKLGGAMTQASVLNVRYGLINPKRVQSVFSMLHTTSTSYILLASLDTSRRHLALNGHERVGMAIRIAEWLREEINKISGLTCMGKEVLISEAAFALDPTKVLIHVHDLGMSGYDVEKWLRNHHRIEVEMSDLHNILCIITTGDSEESGQTLLSALKQLAEERRGYSAQTDVHLKMPGIPHLALSPRDAFYAETESVPLKEAEGRIIAEFIMVYPPGIPILLPGEVISLENIQYIEEHLAVGLPVQGPEDPTIQMVKVIIEEEAITEID